MFRDEDFRMTSFEHAYLYPENITEADVKAYMTASQTENFVNSLVNMLKNYSDPTEIEIVPLIDQPVLLLWGRYDKGNPPENGEILDDIFSNSRFYIIEESGHYIHEEQPQNTADYIKDFLEDYLM